MVEFVEMFGYGAEGRGFESPIGQSATGKLALFKQRYIGTLCFSNQERVRQRKERDGLRLSFAVSKIQWAFNFYCLYSR